MSTVAIIGGGPSGLVSAKSALECRLVPTVLEKSSAIGGLWKPTQGSTWESMKTNLSKYTCMFSDFPWNEQTQNFPTQSEVCQYFGQYVQQFQLDPYIHLNSEVTLTQKNNDKWVVKWLEKGSEKIQIFDYVIIATGIFSQGYIPKIPGIENFKGPIIHSQNYQTPTPFKNKCVAVIGSAFSGSEITSDLAMSAIKVMHCFRRACWVIPKHLMKANSDKLLPLDFVFYSRMSSHLSQSVTEQENNTRKHNWFKQISKQAIVNQELAIEINSNPPLVAISDTYLEEVRKENITIKCGELTQITEDTLIFQNEDRKRVDALIFCTGYQTNLSFLDKNILELVEFQFDNRFQPLILHKCTFHPALSGMAFVGMYRGPFFAVMELQARWACQVFKGITAMPRDEDMILGLQEARTIREKSPQTQFPYGDYVKLADGIASEVGVLPSLIKLQQEDPDLHSRLWQGPFLPVHFRLVGPFSQPELAIKVMKEVEEYIM